MSRSAARRKIPASRGGADGAVATAAVGTAMPAVKQTASTSRLDATANGSEPHTGCRRGRDAWTAIPARVRVIDGPAAVSSAMASNTAAVLMTPPDR